jgi:hypothetical protein
VRTAADTATTYASQSFMALLLRYSTGAILSAPSRGHAVGTSLPHLGAGGASLPSTPREAASPVPGFGSV